MSIRFVEGNQASQNENLLRASKEVEIAKLTIEWITEEEALQLTQNDKCMYVCDPFKGPAFEHIKTLGCRIVGPQCVLSCLSLRQPIPKTDHPVYSIAMRNIVVSCSNIEKEAREKIHTYVEWMGGTVSRNFTDVVTHLVAGEVGSKKYHVAVSLNKSVVLPEWVYAVWKAGKQCHVDATDPEFHCHKCPIFKGCIICVTGLEHQDRKDVKRLTEENGGRYTGELKLHECTHLIVSTPKGQKYDFARRWKIHCVSLKWFKESLSKGACQDENLYNVEPSTSEDKRSTSTPNRKSPNSRLSTRIPDVSSIAYFNESKIDDTMMTTMNITTMNTSINNMTTINMDIKGQDVLSDLDLFKPPEDFLDACKIYLSGFSGSRLEKVRKIINIGGGTRFSQLTENVTHVIVETGTEDHIQLVMSSDFRPEVVTVEWLVECYKQGSTVSELPYICLDVPTTHVVSPQKPVKNVPDKQSTKQKKWPKDKEVEGDDEESVMMQYLSTETQDFSRIDTPELDVTTKQEIDELNILNEMEKDAENDGEEEEDDNDATQIDQEIVAEDEDYKGIFFGKKFSLIGFLEDQAEVFEEMVTSEGGVVIATSDSPEADYQIVPITGNLAHNTVRNVATNCWLQQCVESHELHDLSSNPLFLPVMLDLSKTPLKGCVISISQYQGVERDCILHLVELMGATCQEYLVRKSKNNLEANTHLLLRDPEGSKYDAAIKWKIPTVGKRWLLECAKQGKHVAEEKYLVDNQGHDSTLLSNSETHDNHEIEEVKTVDNIPQKEAEEEEDERVEIQAADEKNDQKVEAEEQQQDGGVIIQNVNKIESDFADEQIDTNIPETLKSPAVVTIPTEEIFEQDSKEAYISDSKQTISKGISENIYDDVQFSKPRPVSRRQSELQRTSTTSEDTPSKFLAPGYRPKFDIAAALASLETPPSQKKSRHVRKSSVSLDDLMRTNLKQAIKNSEVKSSDDNVFEESQNSQASLKGVIICVSMKLNKKLTVYNKIATELGADFRWTYDPTCTHFIYQGRAKDSSKELKLAKEQNKHVVSPHWLFACQEENAYLEPSLYPHTYNPKLSLTVSKTPVRSTRRSARKIIASPPASINTKYTSVAPAVVNTKSSVAALPAVVDTKPTIATAPVPVDTRTIAATPAARAAATNKQPDDEVASSASKVEHSVAGQESTIMKDTVTEEELMMFDAMEKQEEQNQQQNEESVDRTEEEKELEKEGSLEEREDFQKQMEQLMTSAMPSKGGKRRSRRLNSNTSATNMNTSAGSVSEERVNSSGSSHRARSKMSIIAEDPEAKSNKAEVPIEASQNIQITWDDPAGREVRKEIMEQLQRSSSPTQQQQMSFETEDLKNESNNTTVRELMEAQELLTKEVENEDRMLEEQAFKAPPIRLPPARPAVAPAPLTEKQEKEIEERPPPIFMLSFMTPQEKMDYAALIEQLGGIVKEAQYFDGSTTHLVVGTPTRNEKYLSAMAMGKWLLSKSYLEACRESNHFVEEDIHEWGSAENLSTLPDQVAKLAKAAPRWRKKLQEERNKSASGICSGAFHSWKILLGVSRKKEDGFKRLLQAGGAKILQVRPPFNHCHYEEATHAFITDDAASQVDIHTILDYQILCLKPEYIAEFLTRDPQPDPDSYRFKGAKGIRNSEENNSKLDLRKRKTSTNTDSPSKKTRLR
ncbi:DNA topoisomerase 2-binding protein 1-like isoform X2 [Anneissia japonica]|uniref:DNA topoisomerase 2-binding protein 1-like isoform X2 n=1 Tax=Anneissia japonica TaxID=1529436 RepID=UPI001425A41C|nr:DNA topoisomerase 2-binding protein 1-like isoform X2 [Anneissia japonica]